MSEEDPYGNEMYKTRPELLCPPSMKNITGMLKLVTLVVSKSFFTLVVIGKSGLEKEKFVVEYLSWLRLFNVEDVDVGLIE